MDAVVEIDGSYGEGGGQVLRTALTLSALTGQPTHIRQVRAKRHKPGLSPQHLSVVLALAEVCDAEVEGAHLRSTEVSFAPRAEPQPGSYTFDVAEAAPNGSAGSVPLLFQALLFPLVLAGERSRLTLKGGTHVPWSPTFDYLDAVYLPTLAPMGVEARCQLKAWGFYPAGGGKLLAEIRGTPNKTGITDDSLQPLQLTERGALQRLRGQAVACNLPSHIPERMAGRAQEVLSENLQMPADIMPLRVQGAGPGAGIFLTAEYEQARAGFAGHGKRGKPSETVAEEACRELLAHHAAKAPADPHLADQLLLPMALARGRSEFRTSRITPHLLTNAHVIRHFLPVSIEIDGDTGAPGHVVVREASEA